MFRHVPPASAVTKPGIFQDSGKLPGLLSHKHGVRCKLGSSLAVLSGCTPPQDSLDSQCFSRAFGLPVEEGSREPICFCLRAISPKAFDLETLGTYNFIFHFRQNLLCLLLQTKHRSKKRKKQKKPHRTQQFSFNQLQKFYNSFDLAAMCFFFALSVQILEPYFAAVKFSLRRGPSTQKSYSHYVLLAGYTHVVFLQGAVVRKGAFSPC